MTLKEQLVARGFVSEHVPSGYQIIGDILLAKFPTDVSVKAKKELAKAIAEMLPNVRLVGEIKRVSGELRKPIVSLLFTKSNKSFETVHIENGIKFKLDVRKIMFSKGNASERSRVAPHIKPNETIIDMFAGIGYFSLGFALAQPTAKIIAIEKNPVAFKYLKQNILLNKINNIMPIKGDCRRAKITEKADRISMGYFPHTEKFLPIAFHLIKNHAVIHYHNIYRDAEMRTKPIDELERAATRAGYKITSIAQHVVKSFAPKVWHVVVDVELEKEGCGMDKIAR